MKESFNQINIEGIVAENNVRIIEKENKKYVCGDIIIQVDKENGETNTIPVSFISADVKADGTPNKNYTRLLALQDYNSIASAGIENATKVQIRGAKINENAFLPDGAEEVVTNMRISSNFFTKVSDANFTPQAGFNIVGFIVAMEEEEKTIDGERQPTGRVVIKLATIHYNNKVEVLSFIVEEEKYIDFVKAHYSIGDTVQLGGDIRFTQETVENEVDMGFGDSEIKRFTKRTKELIVRRGSGGALDAEQSYEGKDITEGLKNRQAFLNTVKEKAQAKAQPKASIAKTSEGFSF